MARPNILNVRKHLEHVVSTCDDMLQRDGKYPTGLRLAPIDVDNLKELRFYAKAILRKHASKKTRKDIYVERQ